MPVTKTAKRALRSSKRKALVNRKITTRLEVAVKLARRTKLGKNIRKAISLVDKAKKKKVIHKNKAARMKASLSKLMPRKRSSKPAKK